MNQDGTCGCLDRLVCLLVSRGSKMEEKHAPLKDFTFLFSDSYRLSNSPHKLKNPVIRNSIKTTNTNFIIPDY
jgi:hypothetical protein